jgi:hypothetical protein
MYQHVLSEKIDHDSENLTTDSISSDLRGYSFAMFNTSSSWSNVVVTYSINPTHIFMLFALR